MKKELFKEIISIGEVLKNEELCLIQGGDSLQSGESNQPTTKNPKPCDGKQEKDHCLWNGKSGVCRYIPFSYGLVCWVN